MSFNKLPCGNQCADKQASAHRPYQVSSNNPSCGNQRADKQAKAHGHHQMSSSDHHCGNQCADMQANADIYHQANEQPIDDYELHQQEQLQRSIQASQQMLFDGLAVSIGMIEELEHLQHEDDGRMRKSSYPTMGYTPLHARNVPEALSKIEASLATLGAQLKFAPPDASAQAKTKMLEAVLLWLGTRASCVKGITEVDHYAVNILELLFFGDITIHRQMREARMRHPEKLDEQSISNVVSWISKGRAYSEEVDKNFKEDTQKAAVLSNLRNEGTFQDGIMRAKKLNPALEQIFEKFKFTETSQR
ncbi:uncharacterized protein LOC144826926 [Lissotriton helveticus]